MAKTKQTEDSRIEPLGLSPEQAAAYSGLSIDFLKKARIYGHVDGLVGPPYRRITPRCVLYLRTDLDAYLVALPSYKHIEEEPRASA